MNFLKITLKYFCLFILFFYVDNASAQSSSWSLERCIQQAMENNLTIKQQKLNLALSEEDLKQSSFSTLPSINLSGGPTVNFGRSVDPLTYQFVNQQITTANLGLSGSLNLFSGLSQINRIAQNNYKLKSDKEQVRKTENDVSISVISSYLLVLYNKDLIKTSELQKKLSEIQFQRAEKNFQIGNINKGELLEVKAQLQRDELNLTNAQNQYDITKLNLVQLLDLDPKDPFEIEEPIISLNNSDEYTFEEVFTSALNNQPDIKINEYRLKSASKGVNIAYGALSPRLSLIGGLNTGYSENRTQLSSITPKGFDTIGFTQTTQEMVVRPAFQTVFEKTPFNNQIKDNFSYYVGLNINIPLFNGWQTQSNISRSRINFQSAQINADLAKNNLQKNIYQAIADYKAAQKKFYATESAFNSLKESFDYSQQKYDVGLMNSIDYNLAKNSLAKAEIDFIQSKYDLIFKMKILDFYQGKNLTFN